MDNIDALIERLNLHADIVGLKPDSLVRQAADMIAKLKAGHEIGRKLCGGGDNDSSTDALIERLRHDPVWCLNNGEEIADALATLREENKELVDAGLRVAKNYKEAQAEIAKLREQISDMEEARIREQSELIATRRALAKLREALDVATEHNNLARESLNEQPSESPSNSENQS